MAAPVDSRVGPEAEQPRSFHGEPVGAGGMYDLLRKGKKDHWISTTLYLAMGWLILFALGPLIRGLPMAGVWWLVAGGFTYSFGIVFYAWHRLPFNHAIWHLFVLGGSACHVIAVCGFVLSPRLL